MPATDVVFYRDEDGSVPVLDWLTEVGRKNRKALEKCTARIDQLRQTGHELRRPAADYLRDGIFELRTRVGRVQYRILYFFHGGNAVVLAHGIIKESDVPNKEINRAIARRKEFEQAPDTHTYREGITNGQEDD
jgi:phage-related protein